VFEQRALNRGRIFLPNAAMITGGNPTNPPIEAVSWFSTPAQRSGEIPRA